MTQLEQQFKCAQYGSLLRDVRTNAQDAFNKSQLESLKNPNPISARTPEEEYYNVYDEFEDLHYNLEIDRNGDLVGLIPNLVNKLLTPMDMLLKNPFKIYSAIAKDIVIIAQINKYSDGAVLKMLENSIDRYGRGGAMLSQLIKGGIFEKIENIRWTPKEDIFIEHIAMHIAQIVGGPAVTAQLAVSMLAEQSMSILAHKGYIAPPRSLGVLDLFKSAEYYTNIPLYSSFLVQDKYSTILAAIGSSYGNLGKTQEEAIADILLGTTMRKGAQFVWSPLG